MPSHLNKIKLDNEIWVLINLLSLQKYKVKIQFPDEKNRTTFETLVTVIFS
jgi:hypothetical protein